MNRTATHSPARRRDAALRRLRRTKQVIATGSLILAGAVATAAARTVPGHAPAARTPTVRTSAARIRAGHPRSGTVTRPGQDSVTRGPRRVHHRRGAAVSAAARTETQLTPASSAPAPAPVSSATVTSGGS